ncbi:unnamed protein product [Gemmataceae bacterium]|nr:unnamed protein product [Gemmataceae bacterium]VTU00988.1 unnamed protein product [Gemmataceae bacterium]
MDLTPLIDWLKLQGNVGALIVVLLPVLSWFLSRKYGPPAVPANGSPTPTLDVILKALGIAPKGRPATAADLPHEVHLQIQSVLDKAAADKAAKASKELTDYTALNLIDAPPAPAK